MSGSWFGGHEQVLSGAEFDLAVAADNQLTLERPDSLPRTWTEPEPDGVYRLEPARALHLRVVDADGRAFLVIRPILRDATGREFAVAGEAAANLRLDQVPLGELTAIVRPAGGGDSRTFTTPAAATEWTLVWR